MVHQETRDDFWDWDEAAQAIASLPTESIERICGAMARHWIEAGRTPEELRAIIANALRC